MGGFTSRSYITLRKKVFIALCLNLLKDAPLISVSETARIKLEKDYLLTSLLSTVDVINTVLL